MFELKRIERVKAAEGGFKDGQNDKRMHWLCFEPYTHIVWGEGGYYVE